MTRSGAAVRFTVLGSSGTYPRPGQPASGYLVEGGGEVIWLDVGPGTLAEAIRRGALDSISAVVVSHVHGDHCSDVLHLLNYWRFGPAPRTSVPFLAPEGVFQRLAAFAGAGEDHAIHTVFASDVVRPGDERVIGEMTLRFGEAVHPVPAVGVRVERDGASVAYSGDTGPGGDLVDLATGADLLVCEATWQGPVAADRSLHHLFAVEAGEVAQRAGAARLLLTHVAPTLDPEQSVAEAAAAFPGPVDHAEPGWSSEW